MLGFFALSALLLASIGIYGVMAYSVAQRTREMGVRMALGASRAAILGLIMRQGLRLAALGLAASLAFSRVLESLLFQIGGTDTQTFFGVALGFLCVAALARIIPALRAMRTSPNEALRYE